MGKESLKTRLYIGGTLLIGVFLFAYFVSRWNRQADWIATIVLSVLGGLTLLFKVEGSTNRTHYDITFVVFGFSLILYGPPVAVIVFLFANLIEWVWHRYPWYIQSFNIACYIIVGVAANSVFEWIDPTRSLATWEGAVAILVAMAVFLLLNHLMVGLIVWVARGENFIESGVFKVFPMMLDWIVLCMGAGAAAVWAYNPPAVILILLPLYLIYTTTRVPALERQVETDAKTGLYHLKYFTTSLDSELSRAARFDRPLTVIMADIDLLRDVNNTYGHLAGDEVIVGVAKILKEMSREYDVVARFGGEEFALLIPETTPDEVFAKIELIRKEIEKTEFFVPTSVSPIKATMSFGLAGREAGMDGKDLIHNADLALYHAKLTGRNRSYVYSKEGYTDFLDATLKQESADRVLDGKTDRSDSPEKSPETDAVPASGKNSERPAAETSSQSGHRRHPKSWVNRYIFILLIAMAGLFSVSILKVQPVDWLGVLIFTILVGATEWASIDIYFRKTAVSTSVVVLIAGILLFGPFCALIMSLTIAVVAWIKHKSPFSRFVFNASNQLFAAIFCILLVNSTGIKFADWSIPAQILGSSVGAIVVYGITSFFIAIGMSLDLGDPVRQIWIEQFGWLAPYYLRMGVIAYALIFSYLHSGVLGTAVILIPFILLRVSQKQFVDRTKDTVNEVKQKNKILQNYAGEIIRLNDGLLDTLAEVIDLRGPYILGHSQQVTHYALLIARQMALSPEKIETIRKASLMHDLGKLGIMAEILSKPSSLTEAEFEIIKQHVSVGAELLRKSQALQSLIPIVLYHHEHFDGKGYPAGLTGPDIPLEARIVCLADSVDAMSSDRPYRRAYNFDEMMSEVRRCSGSQFDPVVVNAFEQVAEKLGPALIIPTNQSYLTKDKLDS